MKKISYRELRDMWFSFWEEKGHVKLPSASLIPLNDPTVLFTTAGMHPLVPYLKGEKHPNGNRLMSIQKCIRTTDIDSVGDSSHCTFFEMLGNWSLGDYFKKEVIPWSFEFLTSDKYLGIPKEKLFITVFEGDDDFPKDMESFEAWKSVGVDEEHIFFLPRKHNFWILGNGLGPCGPDSEMFYDTGKEPCSINCNPSCDCGKYLEIWNDVFMEYNKDEIGNITKLPQQNVDTGMGLERTLVVFNELDSVYDSEIFINQKNKLEELSNMKYDDNIISFRIIMDHIRTATFILGDKNAIAPSNVGQGYVLRRLIRRTIRHLKKLNINNMVLDDLAMTVILDYKAYYPELDDNKEFIFKELRIEEEKFNNTIKDGEKLFFKLIKKLDGNIISGYDAFKLFDTFGFPIEFTEELAKENNLVVDKDGFDKAFLNHQEKSKTISEGQFKGGLADDGIESTKYHTLAHLLLRALQQIYGNNIVQKGSNITKERLRFDFNLDHKMSDEEKSTLEDLVNEKIKEGLEVTLEEMTYDDAKKSGAHGSFDDKYQDIVKVYTIGYFSKEICGGPHINNTNELGRFKIIKEESVSAGVRRIKAILE